MNLLQRFITIAPPVLKDLPPGPAGEEWVSYLYRKNGFEIIARNYALYGKKQLGEIDIVCVRKPQLVVVEVKTRASESFMPIVEAVGWRKQELLRRMAKLFIQQHPKYEGYDLQIDIAAVLWNPVDNCVQSVKIVENAIEDPD